MSRSSQTAQLQLFALAAMAFFFLPFRLPAQSTNATLTGTITDTQKGAIPDASVTATNVGTGLVSTTTTNADGIYSIVTLSPGSYKLKVDKAGFQSAVRTDLTLHVKDAVTLNIELSVGAVSESVTVSGGAPLINTTTSELSSVINEAEVKELPLNGRDPSSLVLLSPGTANVLNTSGGVLQNGFSFPTETGASANGGRQGSTYYLLDGVPNMDTYLLLSAPFPNADATQEFRVVSNNFDAHYGFSPGAVVSIQTKSGTNQIHGGAFEFLRNGDLNSSNFFSHKVDPLKRNQFGGFVGGPVIKDKLFFFANYQGTRNSTQSSTNVTDTPTAAMLNGDFSAVPITLKGPFVNNRVNPALFSPAAVTLATTALPLGQVASTGQVTYAHAPTTESYDEGTARLDWNISPQQRLSARSFIDYYQLPATAIPGNILSVSGIGGALMKYYNGTLDHTWTISPTMVNDLSIFWNQMSAHNSAPQLDSSGKSVCLSRYINVTEPGCYLEGLGVTGGFGSDWTEPSQEVRTSYGFSESLEKTLAKHTISVGGNLWHQYAAENTQYPGQPIVQFGGNYTGFGLADFLLGDVQSYTQGAGEIAAVHGWQFGIFAQDQYRLKPNLTVTLGLRWDPNLPPSTIGARGSAFHPGQQSTVFPNAPTGLVFPGDTGVNAALMPTSYGYYEPRIGVAWQPSSMPHTAIRAAFGLFASPLPYSYYNHTADISPYSPTYVLNGSPANPISFQNPWASFPGTNYASPFPPFASVGYKPSTSSTFSTPVTIPSVFSPDFKLGMTQSWNLSIQQQVTRNMSVQIAYVASESYHQAVWVDQNPGINNRRSLYPPFSTIDDIASWGTASFNSLQASVERRLSHNLQFQSSFTWEKAIDIASSGNPALGGHLLGDPFNRSWNRGISDVDVPLNWVSNFVYITPDLRGWNPLVRSVLGAWEASGIVTLRSGQPFSISGGSGNNNSGALQNADRADFISGQPLDVQTGSRQQWLNRYFNTAAFAVNAPGTFGTSGRNILFGPGVFSADVGLIKNWTVKERFKTQFRWEMFNALNHPSFGLPNTNPSSGNFGQITTVGSVAPRVMQGALKFSF